MSYQVKTEVFEGPLDLLLSLIEKRKFFINDISLSKVADDFIEYIKSREDFPTAEGANFILIASTLVLLKSKSLLPNLSLTEEEETSIEELEKRLRIYKKFKALSRHIKEKFGNGVIFFPSSGKNIEPVFSPGEEVTLSSIEESIRELINSFPEEDKTPQATVEKVISLEEVIENLTERIQNNLKTSFREFSGSKSKEKINVIVSFLALLELVKREIVAVNQENQFEDIEITNNL